MNFGRDPLAPAPLHPDDETAHQCSAPIGGPMRPHPGLPHPLLRPEVHGDSWSARCLSCGLLVPLEAL